jgi:DNA-binding HxlR family transcriptional regulator
VEYEITPLGRSLQTPFKALYAWTLAHLDEVERARQAFDGRRDLDAPPRPMAAAGSHP